MLWSSIERVQFDISPPAAGQVSRCRGLQVGWSTSSQAAAALWKPFEQRHPAPAHQTLPPTCLLLPGNGNVLQFCLSNIGGSFSVYIVQQWGHLRVGGPSPSSFRHFSHFVPFSHFWLSTGFGSKGKYCLWPDVFPEIVLCDSWTMVIMMMMMMIQSVNNVGVTGQYIQWPMGDLRWKNCVLRTTSQVFLGTQKDTWKEDNFQTINFFNFWDTIF